MDAAVPTLPPTSPPPGAPMARVLVVDDHRDTAESLGLLGREVRAVRSGLAAFSAVIDFTPDACVVDIRMPGMDGFTVAGRLRDLLGAGVRLVAVTGERSAASDPPGGGVRPGAHQAPGAGRVASGLGRAATRLT